MSGVDFEKEFGLLFSGREEASERAPSSLKARLYSALIRKQQESGPLASLDESVALGHVWRSRTRKVIWLEPNYESEQVLKIGELARSRWRKMFADLIVPDHFAEAIAKIQFAREPHVDADVRSENRSGVGKRARGQHGSAPGCDQTGAGARQMGYPASGSQIRTDSAASPPEVDQEIRDACIL